MWTRASYRRRQMGAPLSQCLARTQAARLAVLAGCRQQQARIRTLADFRPKLAPLAGQISRRAGSGRDKSPTAAARVSARESCSHRLRTAALCDDCSFFKQNPSQEHRPTGWKLSSSGPGEGPSAGSRRAHD